MRCAVFLILNLQCWVKQNYLWTLYCVVVYCNAVLTVPQCPPPYGQELNPLVYKTENKKTNKQERNVWKKTPATSDFYNPLFWKMN